MDGMQSSIFANADGLRSARNDLRAGEPRGESLFGDCEEKLTASMCAAVRWKDVLARLLGKKGAHTAMKGRQEGRALEREKSKQRNETDEPESPTVHAAIRVAGYAKTRMRDDESGGGREMAEESSASSLGLL